MAADYVLGIDYGARRVGLAIAQSIARLPRPLVTLPNDDQLLTHIHQVVTDEQVGHIVVGVPRSLDGSATAQSALCEAFAQQVATHEQLPVTVVDETLSSVEAETYLANSKKGYSKGEVDALAATVILERFFEEYMIEQRGAD